MSRGMEQSDRQGWHTYHSLPLKQDEFRLLKLYPASTQQAPIFFDLFKVEYGSPDVPDYDAISYRWGDPYDRQFLAANGQQMSVTASLHTALKNMRDESSVRIFWIDGVCINQDDTAERGQQVLMMGSIFSGAQCVRIFLGEAKEGDNMAQAMNLLSELDTPVRYPRFVERVKSDQDGSRGLISLLRRPYWQRMWVFQEIVLSRKTVVHCGPYHVPWEYFRMLDRISGNPDLWLQAQVSCDWISELRRALFEIAHFFISKAEAQDLRNILVPTRRLQCADPRDKLFALLGLCNTIPTDADYLRPIRDIYSDFTRQYLETERDLSTLLTSGLWNPENGPNLDLPSWVPDYRGAHGVDIRYLAASHLKRFNASLDMKPSIDFPPSLNSASHNDHPEDTITGCQYMLATRGVILDMVSTTATLEKGQDSPGSLLRLTEPKGVHPRPSGEEDPAQILFRTMIFDDNPMHALCLDSLESSSGSERYIRLALGFAHCLSLDGSPGNSEAGFLDSFARLKIGDRTLRQYYEHLLETDPGELQFHHREFLIRSKETSEQSASTFFVTKNNRIGKGPRDLDQGDCVAVIYGCRIPLVLRPSGARYQLIGPCYMHGAMFGEVIERLSDAGTSVPQESEIVLV